MNLLLNCLVLLHFSLYARTQDVELISCSHGMNRCSDNSKCVSDGALCNYNPDCDDHSDESYSMCKLIHENKRTCSSGQIHHPSYNCRSITDCCNSYFTETFRVLCSKIKGGLKPSDNFATLEKEISKLKTDLAEVTTLREQDIKLKDILENLAAAFNNTQWNKDDCSSCPPLYVNISGNCVALFTVAQVSWHEAKQFCESISGTLGVISKIHDFYAVLKHLKDQELEINFWVGGYFNQSKHEELSNWMWLDNKDIALGAPFWRMQFSSNCTKRGISGGCYHYSLAPLENRDGFCLAIDYQFHYYFSDQNCNEKRSPLCFFSEEK